MEESSSLVASSASAGGRRRLSAVVTPAVGVLGLFIGTWLNAAWLNRFPWTDARVPTRGPALPVVQAMTADSDGSFAVCTSPIDNGFEGFFMLDFRTGDLSGGVLNQSTGKFTGAYRCNVWSSIGFEPGESKQSRLLLVSGLSGFRRGQAGPLAQSVLYVTDASTGVTAAYGIPWNPQQASRGFTSELVLLDVANPRGTGSTP